MAVLPLALLAAAALLLCAMAAQTIGASRGIPARAALRDGGLGLLAVAAGLALTLPWPQAATSPSGALGTAVVLFGFGALWAATRRLSRGMAPRPTAAALGGLGWLAWILLVDPSLGWRIGVGATIAAAYGATGARELLRDRARRRATQHRRGAAAIAPSGIPAPAPPSDEELDDTLTGIGNHRALLASGATLVAQAAASGRPLALLAMDLDGFGRVNARHGRTVADRLLVAFARLAHDYLPPTSLVCRLDGDVFAALLPGAEAARARAVADELRSLFAHLRLDGTGGPVAARVSIGIAQLRPGRADLAALLHAADRCLDAAKRAGRDRVVGEDDGLRSAA